MRYAGTVEVSVPYFADQQNSQYTHLLYRCQADVNVLATSRSYMPHSTTDLYRYDG